MAPEDLQNTIEQVNNEPAPAAPPPPIEDMDDAEVSAARAAADAEANGEAPPAPAPPAPPAPAAAAPAAAPAASTPPASADTGEQIMVPKSRFDERGAQIAAKDLVIARQQGELEALKTFRSAPGAAAPAAPQPPADPLTALYAEQDALAKQYDNGEIDLQRFTRANREIDTRIFGVREAQLAEKVKPAAAPQGQPLDYEQINGAVRLENRTAQLETQHPYSAHINRSEDWMYLRRVAEDQLVTEGKWTAGAKLNTPDDHIMFRERIALLTDTYGPAMTGKTLQLPQRAAPAAPGAPPARPLADQRRDKLDAAANAPPDLNRLGTQTGPTEFSDNAIEAMDEDAIAALPASVRSRYLGN